MQLRKWEPIGFAPFRRQLDDLFQSFLGREAAPFTNGDWAPALDEIETPEEIIIKAELPGMDEKDISITLSGNHLMIQGEKKSEKEEKEKHFHRVERSYGRFQRAVPLPASVDSEKISAEYKKGLLEVHLPKKPADMPKQIKVSTK